jgi:hypothetical protein
LGEKGSPLGVDHQETDEYQRKSNQCRVAKGALDGLFQKEANNPSGDRGQDYVKDESLLKILNAPSCQDSKKTSDQAQPVPPEIPKNGQKSPGVEGRVKRQAVQKRIIPLEEPW